MTERDILDRAMNLLEQVLAVWAQHKRLPSDLTEEVDSFLKQHHIDRSKDGTG